MLKIGFKRSKYDHCLYYKNVRAGNEVYLHVYVDDMLSTSLNKAEILRHKNHLRSEFHMKYSSNAKKILGMVLNKKRHQNVLKTPQEAYLNKVITKFVMKDAKFLNVLLAPRMNRSSVQSPKAGLN